VAPAQYDASDSEVQERAAESGSAASRRPEAPSPTPPTLPGRRGVASSDWKWYAMFSVVIALTLALIATLAMLLWLT
jgi:hypothetical protein